MTACAPLAASIPAWVCAWALAACAWTKPAAAHAPAEATGIFFDGTGSQSSRRWVRTNRGVILKEAAGEPWRLLCNEAYSATLSEVVPMIAAPDALVVGTYYGGILRVASDGCSVKPAEASLAGRHVTDLASTSNGGQYFALLTPNGEQPGGILMSADAGRSWAEVGEIPAFGSALGVAPSDSNRLYVSAQVESQTGEAMHRLFVSSDAGAHFAPQPLTLLDSEVRAFVLAVDPLDPDRVLLRVLGGDPEVPERLLLSEDGGTSLSEVYSAIGPLVAAFDGELVWLGGQAGLFRSDDRGRTFQQVPSSVSHVGCLVPGVEQLTACGYQDLAFGVFQAKPGQAAFQPTLLFSEVTTQVACGDGSQLLSLCQQNLLDWGRENWSLTSGGTAGAANVGATSSAGGRPAPNSPTPANQRPSCSLHSPGAGSSLGGGASVPLALLIGFSHWLRSRGGGRRGARSAPLQRAHDGG